MQVALVQSFLVMRLICFADDVAVLEQGHSGAFGLHFELGSIRQKHGISPYCLILSELAVELEEGIVELMPEAWVQVMKAFVDAHAAFGAAVDLELTFEKGVVGLTFEGSTLELAVAEQEVFGIQDYAVAVRVEVVIVTAADAKPSLPGPRLRDHFR